MQIGQRINLIKKIAARMSEFNYPDGDLMLRQFELPWSDTWNGDPYTYYLNMIEKADSERLVEVHEYLFPSEGLPHSKDSQQKGSWSKGTLRLFISHSSARKLLAVQLKEKMQDYGIECFVAHEDIEPTKEWLKEIQVAINTCHALVACICNNFKSSNYCDQEVGFALQRGILVIPVRVEEKDPYGFVAPIQAITANGKNPEDVASEIHKLILNHPITHSLAESAQLMALDLLVDRFLSSSDYGTSSSLLKKLEEYETVPAKVINKISENWGENDQITGCNRVPQRIQVFLKKHC